MENIYYSPELFGLELIDELSDGNAGSGFDILVVLRHKDSGRLFWGRDEGCSCPSPFENSWFHGPDSTDLREVTRASWEAFEAEVGAFPTEMSFRNSMLDKARKACHEFQVCGSRC